MTTEGPIQVSTGNDDAHEADGGASFSATNSSVYINRASSAGNRFNGGYRFNSVDIANGDTIDAVDLELYFRYAGDDLGVTILANDVDDAVDFSTDADVTTRIDSAATVASSSWVHENVVVGFLKSSTDDAVDSNAVVQEVIDRGGWASGADLVMLCQAREDLPFSYCWARSYDGVSSQAAKLTIDYTIGGGGPPAFSSRRLLSGTGR